MNRRYLVSCKVGNYKFTKGILLKKECLERLKREAVSIGKIPVLIFRFLRDTDYYAVVPLNDLRRIERI